MEHFRQIVLPSHEQMVLRLLPVGAWTHLINLFYPRLLSCAGKERSTAGFVTLLLLAGEDYNQRRPLHFKAIERHDLKLYATALIDDQEALEEILWIFDTFH